MYDIISIGDAGLDTFVILKDATVNCVLNKASCQFCINYADKIPVDSWQQTIGGNAANNAVASNRLGLRAAIWTIIGPDSSGVLIKKTMKAEKVAVNFIELDKKHPTNQSLVMNFQGERTILVHHNKRSYKLPKLPASSWVYLTSMGSGSEKIFPALLNYLNEGRVSNDGTRHDSAESNKIKLAFNPGTFQMKLGINILRPVLAQTTALFVNLEEAGRILGTPEEKDMHKLTRNLAALGPKIIVITNGPEGAHAWDGNGCYFMPILKEAPVVERTGAGDAFASAFVAALLYNHGISEALRWGTFNSASVIGKVGPEAGLLRLREMKRQLANHKTLIAQACAK